MSFDHQMSDFSQSETESDQISIPADIAAAYKRGPPQVVYKGTWKQHHDNERAFTRSSVIWQLGDEYEKLSAAFTTAVRDLARHTSKPCNRKLASLPSR